MHLRLKDKFMEKNENVLTTPPPTPMSMEYQTDFSGITVWSWRPEVGVSGHVKKLLFKKELYLAFF